MITFLGIFLDTVKMELQLPCDKLEALTSLLRQWSTTKKKATKRELLSLTGKLSFAAKVIPAGRIFLRRLIDLTTLVKKLHHHIPYNSNSLCQSRHPMVAQLPSRMQWSQSDAPSRLANHSRPEPIHRCIWYTGFRSLFQRSSSQGRSNRKNFCNHRSSGHLE